MYKNFVSEEAISWRRFCHFNLIVMKEMLLPREKYIYIYLLPPLRVVTKPAQSGDWLLALFYILALLNGRVTSEEDVSTVTLCQHQLTPPGNVSFLSFEHEIQGEIDSLKRRHARTCSAFFFLLPTPTCQRWWSQSAVCIENRCSAGVGHYYDVRARVIKQWRAIDFVCAVSMQ